ncbi:hypothetical protein KY495_20590 [Massilia sp. PAMC28688]|uniref:hypothetical protein n=1 Tax=Massilia sp. PAMC28688 TaxID=2861283 RepID=UPI001C62663C|nr:hypothetical protein [Massilia sp. PAMC28688]QYF93068.1 hypothetical protein KY495_20590 [Massilia sp. PAMC28688]
MRSSIVPFALAGGLWLLWLLGHNVSVASEVGIIALAEVSAEFGVVIGAGTKSEVRQLLAAPMLGGMIRASLLSMSLVPAVYMMLFRARLHMRSS